MTAISVRPITAKRVRPLGCNHSEEAAEIAPRIRGLAGERDDSKRLLLDPHHKRLYVQFRLRVSDWLGWALRHRLDNARVDIRCRFGERYVQDCHSCSDGQHHFGRRERDRARQKLTIARSRTGKGI